MIEPCKHCGCPRVFVHAQWSGPALMWFDESGENTEVDNDRLALNPSTTVRCEDCGRIRRDLAIKDRRIISKELADD